MAAAAEDLLLVNLALLVDVLRGNGTIAIALLTLLDSFPHPQLALLNLHTSQQPLAR